MSEWRWWLRRGIWQWLRARPRAVERFVQRGRRGWSDEDTWSFDHYLARVIREGIVYLKANTHGHPAGLTPEKWYEILDAITYTFDLAEQIVADGWRLFPDGEEWTQEWYQLWSDFAKVHRNKGFTYVVTTEEEYVKYQHGWDMFRKYFFGLWD